MLLKLKINIKIDFYAINCEENFKGINIQFMLLL
jgi:hypothetical protein